MGKIVAIGVMLVAVGNQFAAAQPAASGFFMVAPAVRNCDHRMFTRLNDKEYCVARDPIIPITQFQSVKNLGSADHWAVDVKLTEEGLATMRKINAALPEARFLLAVEGKAIAVFDTNGKCVSPITYDDLKWAERHLERLIKK